MKVRLLSLFAGALMLLAANIQSANADLADGFGVNFTADTYSVNAADQPGLVSTPNVTGANWNNIGGGSGSGIALQDYNATPNVATLAFNSTGAYNGFSGTSTANTSTNTMYQAGIFGSNITPEVSITVTNVPYGEYDVYVYASAETSDNSTLSMSDGTTTFYYNSGGQFNSDATSLLLTTSTNIGSPTTGPGQYQVFHETGPTFTLTTGGSITNVISNNVYGFQVKAVPEPGSLVLAGIGLGVFSFTAYRRRRMLGQIS